MKLVAEVIPMVASVKNISPPFVIPISVSIALFTGLLGPKRILPLFEKEVLVTAPATIAPSSSMSSICNIARV